MMKIVEYKWMLSFSGYNNTTLTCAVLNVKSFNYAELMGIDSNNMLCGLESGQDATS